MSWHFSRAVVAGFSEANSLDIELFAPLRSASLPDAYSWQDKMTEALDLFQSGMMSDPSTENLGADVLIWYLQDFLAKTSAVQEKEPASMENAVDYGLKQNALFARWNQKQFGWKTVQCSAAGDLAEFSETWPQWGLMQNGECWELKKPVLPTNENVSGFELPTPSGVHGGKNNVIGRPDEWGGSSNPLRGTVIGSMRLPEFEELVMGLPISWTALTPLGTAKFQEWLLEHGTP